MYSETDIESAVKTGIFSADAAAAFRDHVAEKRNIPAVDEEHFRLIGSFNDVFLTLAIGLLLALPIASGHGILVAMACWAIAEFVTRRRRIALPSIVLSLAFSAAIFLHAATMLAGDQAGRWAGGNPDAADYAYASLICLAATFGYWWRFRVPITQAILAGALLSAVVHGAVASFPEAHLIWPLLGLGGVAIFAYAMVWDLSDRERLTQRSDVAFWLHLLCAPLVAHSLFRQFGVLVAPVEQWAAPVLLAYILFAMIALVVDRRAILVSGLGYALVAVAGLFGRGGGDGILPATLLLGGTLLLLGLFWTDARAAIMIYLPEDVRRRLPPIRRAPAGI